MVRALMLALAGAVLAGCGPPAFDCQTQKCCKSGLLDCKLGCGATLDSAGRQSCENQCGEKFLVCMEETAPQADAGGDIPETDAADASAADTRPLTDPGPDTASDSATATDPASATDTASDSDTDSATDTPPVPDP